MFQNIGFSELLLIAVVALVIFGPQKLPEIGRMLGKTLREFKQVTGGLLQEVKQPLEEANPSAVPERSAPVTAAQAPVAQAEPAAAVAGDEPAVAAVPLAVAEPVNEAASVTAALAPDPVTPVVVEAPKAAAVAFVTKKSVVRVQGEGDGEAPPAAPAPSGESASGKRLPD